MNPDELLALARRHRDAGRPDLAEPLYQSLLQANPEHPDPHLLLAEALREQGRLDDAAEQYRRALARFPGHVELLTNLGTLLAQIGRPDEALDHLHAAVRLRPDFAAAHHNLGVALAQFGPPEQAEAALREALRLRPDYAEAAYNLGSLLLDQARYAEAADALRRALALRPAYGEALNNLGLALTGLGRPAEAAVFLRQATRLRPADPAAHNNLGLALADLGRFAEAEAAYHEALRLDPAYADAHGNLGNASKEQGRTDEALAAYQLALWLKPDCPSTHWNRALTWLQAGDYERGWAEYEWRWRKQRARPRSFAQPVWDGAPLAGRGILIHMEQGLGDMIQFVRYAPLVKARGGTVLVECPPFLVPLFGTCPGIDRLVPEGSPPPAFDVHAPLLSLPRLLGTTLATVPADVPYLAADPGRVAAWKERLAALEGYMVGIVWQGNPHHKWDRHRSVPLRRFAPLAAVPGVRLVSLQKGPGTEQLRQGNFPVEVLAEELDPGGGFVETAALLKNLDLVVTVDTAAAHLAGALGVPAWVALSAVSDWRWLRERDDSPWYPTLRLFRQDQPGAWGPVFARLAEALRQRAATARP